MSQKLNSAIAVIGIASPNAAIATFACSSCRRPVSFCFGQGEVRRQNVAQLSLRSSQCAAHSRSKMVSCGYRKACGHSASDVDRWY